MINDHFYRYFAMNNTQGPSTPRAHPCPGSIYLEGHQYLLSRANPFRGHIYADDPSLPGAHPSRGPIGHRAPSMPMTHHCLEPIDANDPAEGPSLPRAHPSILRVYGGPLTPRLHPYLRPIHTEGPWESIRTQGPFKLRAYLCLRTNHPEGSYRPIYAQGPSLPRVHGDPSMPRANPCLGPIPALSINPESIRGLTRTEGPSMPCFEGVWRPIHGE